MLGSQPAASSPCLAAIALAAVTAASPAPAQAAQGVIVTQSTPTYIGAHDFFESNGGVIEVVDGGAADVYPSTIEVGEHFGTVSDANVFLDGVATTNLESLHVLLVAPDGRRALLLGHAGGANAYNGVLLLDDESAAAIPDDAAPASSDVRPSVYGSPGVPTRPGRGTQRRHRPVDVRRCARRGRLGALRVRRRRQRRQRQRLDPRPLARRHPLPVPAGGPGRGGLWSSTSTSACT